MMPMPRTVTDLERMLETRTIALNKCESRFKNILSRSIDGVLIVDEDGVLRFLNPAAEQMLGRRAEDLNGHQIGFPVVIGEATEVDIFRGRGDGAIAEMRVVATEWDGLPARLASLRDVTERARLFGENSMLLMKEQNLRKQLEQANQSKDEFIATLSHELRTPLSAVLAWTKILQSTKADAAMLSKGLDVIERNTRAQNRLIDDMLDVSRILTGKLRLEIKPVDLGEVIVAAIESIAHSATKKGISIQQIRDPGSIQVDGDAERLQQVIWNLLSNAIRHTPAGGNVSVRTLITNGCAEVLVEDTGEGLDADLLPHIFERFRQGDSSTVRIHRGLGLGLSIVRSLVEMHGGNVRASSRGKGCGACFSVAVPLSARNSPVLNAASAACADPECNLNGVLVLLVEDELDLREVLAESIRAHKATVTAVASVQEALLALNRLKHDVLISDIAMPGEDGYSLIRKIRQEMNAIPAAALSANASPDHAERAKRAGYQMFISKPVDPGQLVRSIAMLTVNTRKSV